MKCSIIFCYNIPLSGQTEYDCKGNHIHLDNAGLVGETEILDAKEFVYFGSKIATKRELERN